MCVRAHYLCRHMYMISPQSFLKTSIEQDFLLPLVKKMSHRKNLANIQNHLIFHQGLIRRGLYLFCALSSAHHNLSPPHRTDRSSE